MTQRDLTLRARRAAIVGLMALPAPLKRLLAGAPVVVEGQTLDLDTQLVLRLQGMLQEPAVETLSIPHARRVFDAQTALVAADVEVASVQDRRVGDIEARVYVPAALASASEPRPTLVFIHGGGFVFGGLDSHDGVCRVLAERAGVQVIALDYRLAPEHPFPAAYDDCVQAYRWIVEHADELSVDTARIAVGGDSAGGNLAAGVAIEAAAAGLPLSHQLLIYPVTDARGRSESRTTFGRDYYLTTEFMDLATESYLPVRSERIDPRASPLYAEIPEGLAPATVITAGFDPLRDEGEGYAFNLIEEGVDVTLLRYPGMIHGFANWGIGAGSPRAVREIADRFGDTL